MSKRVLVVDDSTLVRKTATEYLNAMGFEAMDCKSPFEVLGMLFEFRPDVVLLDLDMPGLSGRSVAEVIRKHVSFGDTSIVAFSSADEEVQRDLVESGLINGYYTKEGTLNGLADFLGGMLDGDGAGVGHS